MHVYYKFGLFLIFILSASTCYTRAAPATNQSSSYDDDYHDDYDYYDEHEGASSTTEANGLMPIAAAVTTSTTHSPPLFSQIDVPKRSNHVLEPKCPKACLCLEDYKYIQCSNARLTHVPSDIPSTALIIDLSQNRISELRADDFANCTKVREINLSGNELTEVEQEAFEDLRRLQRLRLADNRLTHIDPNAFTGASDLSMLDLSNNSIELRSDGSFLNQPSLLELSCRNCSWSQLYDETFANLSSLTALKLDQNDFNKKINTKAFMPLRNLIKLKLPELDQTNIQELCNLLKSIDNISFKHFDISCFELVLGASFDESLILATDPPFKPLSPEAGGLEVKNNKTKTVASEPTAEKINLHANGTLQSRPAVMTAANEETFSNFTLPTGTNGDDTNHTILTAGVLATAASPTAQNGEEKPYQVSISQEAINIMLISIMVIAVIGLIIGVVCRKDVGGIKTKCCRTSKPEPKDQVHPAEEIPLNKLA